MEKASVFESFRLHFTSNKRENSDAAAMVGIVTRQLKLLTWCLVVEHIGLSLLTLFLTKYVGIAFYHIAAAVLFVVFANFVDERRFYLSFWLTLIQAAAQSFIFYLVYGDTFSIELYYLLVIPVTSYALLLPSHSNRRRKIFIVMGSTFCGLGVVCFALLPYVHLVPLKLSFAALMVFKVYYIVAALGLIGLETYFFTRRMVSALQSEKTAKAELSVRANFDALTGLYNRYTTNNFLAEAFSNFSRQGTPLSVCMADIDHFKEINDTYGHNTGDFILKAVAQIMNYNIRKTTDFLGRWGGEEFLLIMPAAQQVCFERAEVLRRLIQDTVFEFEGKSISVTLTFGVAFASGDTPTPEALVDLADQMLYKGKKAGRNRTVSCGTD